MDRRVTSNSPPVFDGSAETFHSWLRSVRLWNDLTEVPEFRRGPLVAVNLHGRAAELAESMERDRLIDEGVEYICQFLEANYHINQFHLVSNTFREFIGLKRSKLSQNAAAPQEAMEVYLTKFHNLAHRLHSLGFEIPENVLTFLLIENARLTNDQRSNVMTVLMTNEHAPYSYFRAGQALRQLIIPNPTSTQSPETGMLVDHSVFNSDLTYVDQEVEVDTLPEDFVSDDEHTCLYVRKRNKFFRRRFYNPNGKGKGKKPYMYTPWDQYSKGKKGHYSDKGKGKSKGKSVYNSFGVETSTSSSSVPFRPSTEVQTGTQEVWPTPQTEYDDWSWYGPSYDYYYSNYSQYPESNS